jgi:hypothetical protein
MTSTPGETGTLAILVIQASIFLLQVAGIWKVFQKAGQPGWKAVIPIYNLYIMLKIGGQAWWWLALLVVPLVQLYAVYRIHVGVARAFGKGILWGLALGFGGVLFFPILGFGGYQYGQSG